MNLRGLEAFVAVAEERSFRAAADRMNVVGPAISQLVGRLERDVGLVLFDRSSHHVAVTGAGERLLPFARRVLDAHARLRAEAEATALGTTGTLRIGTTVAMGDELQRVVMRYTAAHPTVRVEIHRATTPEKIRAIVRGDLDVAFLRDAGPQPQLTSRTLWVDRLVAVIPAARDAAAEPGASIDLRTLEGLPLLLNAERRNPMMRRRILGVCQRGGLTPPLGTAGDDVQETLAAIAAGTGWTMLLEPKVPAGAPGIAVRPLDDAEAVSPVALAWRAVTASPETLALARLLDGETAAADPA